MRKSNLKILSLCVMVAGVFGLQNSVEAFSFSSVIKGAACNKITCSMSNGWKACLLAHKNEDLDAIKKNYAACYQAAVAKGFVQEDPTPEEENQEEKEGGGTEPEAEEAE